MARQAARMAQAQHECLRGTRICEMIEKITNLAPKQAQNKHETSSQRSQIKPHDNTKPSMPKTYLYNNFQR
jgi:hypothetical protein